jgi:hypothetical protein
MLFADQELFESVQAELPELTIMLEPCVGVTQRLGLQRTVVFASNDLAPKQSRALKHHQVFGNGIKRNRERPGDFRDRGRLVRDRS